MDPRRQVPRTDRVLADPRLVAASGRLGAATVKRAVVDAQERARAGEIAPEAVADAAVDALPRSLSSTRSVLNATGVVLHTNLGRAPLSPAAVEAVVATAGYADVEFDLAEGRRAGRGRGALAALAAAVPGRSRCWPSTTGPPPWCWPRRRWLRAARWWSAGARWWRSGTASGCPT